MYLYLYSNANMFLCSNMILNFLRQGFAGTGYSSYICQCQRSNYYEDSSNLRQSIIQ